MDRYSSGGSKVSKQIAGLKDELIFNDLSGYIIPSTDEYLSEYVPDFAKRLNYISGFDGSSGLCMILRDCGLFFTDGRYLAQAERQIDLNFFELFDIQIIGNFPFHQYISNDDIIGYDPKLFTQRTILPFSNLLLSPCQNLIDKIWHDQPEKPSSAVYIYPEKYAGESYKDKLNLCRESINSKSAEALLVSSPDSICWLLNLRARDVDFSPLMLGTVIVFMDKIYLFTNPDRINRSIMETRPEMVVLAEEHLQDFISKINGVTLVNEDHTSLFILRLIRNKLYMEDPCKISKACKNNIEIQHSINCHIKDSVALCEFFADLQDFDLKISQNTI